ncbi:LmbE family protein [Gemmatirosa kalamazoonensis]|uniref:LmbE family protein n=1 Tax=Gemmatirosa kalamazoonensis TaxID=861299 RepID=W0R9X0_9BACT|nr:PIG-L family deacetylase [Gemmatirosa kalamazoonensis]AHG87601.1 LmbE family protein [Gemmatirosa kalamazoonensis]
MRYRFLLAAVLVAAPALAQDRGAAALGSLVEGLGTSARVLVIGAHPDDDDTPLLAFLARGRHVRVAYLSLTRGEGGLNLVGGETGEALGVVRTAETLAARDVDGAEQYFTRAYDFGPSKSGDDARAHWGALEGTDALLDDVVKIVRAFRPHVIVTLYDGSPLDGNGQHQEAGRLAREAFARAAEGKQSGGRTWAAHALYRVVRPGEPDSAGTVRLDAGEFSPLLGRTYAEVAAEARARHRTQGGAARGPLGASWIALRLVASRDSGDTGEVDTVAAAKGARTFFAGVDTTLARLRRPAGSAAMTAAMDSLAPAIAAVRAAYRPEDPSRAVVPLALLTKLAARAAALAGVTSGGAVYDPDVARSLEDVWRRAHDALVLASGVAIEATAERETVAHATVADSSDTLRVRVAAYDRGRWPVRVDLAIMAGGAKGRVVPEVMLQPDSVWRDSVADVVRSVTQPWWRFAGREGDLYSFNVDGRSEREMQESTEAGALRVMMRLNVAGTDFSLYTPIVYRSPEPSRVAERPVAAVPGLVVRFDHAVELARAGVPLARPVRLTVTSGYATPRDVDVTLEAPPGLRVDSVTRRVALSPGATAVVPFVISGTPRAGRFVLKASAASGLDKFGWGAGIVTADVMPPQRLYFPAWSNVVAMDVALPARPYVGYVSSVNDGVPLLLSQLGIPVTQLDPSQLAMPTGDLSLFSAIVIAPRAYDTAPVLLSANTRLLDYARRGGTVVVQQGQAAMEQPGVLPFPIALGRPPRLVTDEASPVRVLDAAARVLAAPNRIVDRDFEDWVQDRAAFVPASFDPRWRAPLEVGDPGESPTRGALLVAPYGRGTYVYTTLSLQRQLAAGVPGAARLLVNLLGARSVVGPRQ